MTLSSPAGMARRSFAAHHGPMFTHYTPLHIANIVCHIIGGTVATLAGFVAILARKRGRLHSRAGLVFVYAYSLVILTAIFGVVIFDFRSFLAVATIASSYSLFTGYRATRLRGRRPAPVDRCAALLAFAAPSAFISAMHLLHQPWSPVLTWTVLGSLLAISSYDLLRNILPETWLRNTWVHEHIFKIVGAFDALTATFAATIFPQFQPWSALIPNLAGSALIVTFFCIGPRAWSGSSKKRTTSAPPTSPHSLTSQPML